MYQDSKRTCTAIILLIKSFVWCRSRHRRSCVLIKLPIRDLEKTTTATETRASTNKFLMSKTIAVHLRYKSLYISLPSSAKQQRVMNKFCVFWRTPTRMANCFVFSFEIEPHPKLRKKICMTKQKSICTLVNLFLESFH